MKITKPWRSNLAAVAVILILSACSDEPSVDETDQAIADITYVEAIEAKRKTISEFEYAQGTVQARRRENLVFQASGKVGFLKGSADHPIHEGDSVKRGELIASLERGRFLANVRAAEAGVAISRSSLSNAQAEFERSKKLMEGGAIAGRQFDAAKSEFEQAKANLVASRAQLDDAKIGLSESQLIAPFDGIVAFVNIRRGQFVSPQDFDPTSERSASLTSPIVLIDPASFEVVVEVPQMIGERLKVGQNAYLLTEQELTRLESVGPVNGQELDELLVPGTVTSLSPAVNPSDRSMRARVRTSGYNRLLSDGSFATVLIEVGRKESALVVPVNAIIERGGRYYVFIIDKEMRARRKEVVLGLFSREGQEILSGIEVGQKVVTKGKSRVSNGSVVRTSGPKSKSKSKDKMTKAKSHPSRDAK